MARWGRLTLVPREAAALPLVFRPVAGLRIAGPFLGLASVGAVVGNVLSFIRDGGAARICAAVVLLVPCAIGMALWRRRITLETTAMYVNGIVRTRRITWSEVLAVEQTRRSFIIITEQGDVSAGWIAAERRDLLFRKVLELAKLALDPTEQRWGIKARFVRRPSELIPSSALLRSNRDPRIKGQ